ncbi:hypothetical protein NPIL_434871 [Nephila pilipes]|uniref:Uncharacterized protein n=1 Tax=Nephila pilipes TaxID=299642 RepID=A0A8X6URP1_NEPPI|nr:hypothetical protein NPIL_434871 [Nephila pilipes]
MAEVPQPRRPRSNDGIITALATVTVKHRHPWRLQPPAFNASRLIRGDQKRESYFEPDDEFIGHGVRDRDHYRCHDWQISKEALIMNTSCSAPT